MYALFGISIPNPFKFLTGVGKSIVEAPFFLLNNWLHGLFMDLVNFFEKQFVHPPRPTTGPWLDYLDGNSLGLAQYLMEATFVITSIVVMFYHKALKRVPRLLGMVALVLFAPSVYYWGAANLRGLGDSLAVAASQIYVSHGTQLSHSLLWIPTINNPLGSIAGLFFVSFFGGFLWLVFVMYEGIVIVAVFLGLPLMAMSVISDKALRVLNWTISLFLVAAVAGRPIAVLCLQLGKAAAEHLPLGNTAGGAVFWVVSSLILAILMQGILIWACLRVVSMVTGNMYGRVNTRVQGGRLKARLEKTPEARRQSHRASYGRTFLRKRGDHALAGAGVVGSAGGAFGMPKASGSGSASGAKKGAAAFLAKRYPAAAAAAKAGSVVKSRVTPRSKPGTGTPSAGGTPSVPSGGSSSGRSRTRNPLRRKGSK